MIGHFTTLHQEVNAREPIFTTDTNRALFLDKKESVSIVRIKTPFAFTKGVTTVNVLKYAVWTKGQREAYRKMVGKNFAYKVVGVVAK